MTASRTFCLVLTALLAAVLTVPAAANSGVSNGAIQGVVYSSNGTPLPGVSVVAVRQEAPPIIRSVTTDVMGNFFLADLYVGSYTLGFSKYGFRTITTEGGGQGQQTAVGRQVRAYVEPGRVSTIGSVFLVPDAGAGYGSSVTVVVADAATGESVDDATVIVGPSAASGPVSGGRYVLQVPPAVDGQGQLTPVRAIVQADGFSTQQSMLMLAPNASQNAYFRLEPSQATLLGQVRLGYGIPAQELTEVRIVVDNVDPRFGSGRVVDRAGNFEVTVPASSTNRVRSYNLSFMLNGASVARLTNVIAPRAGARTIPGPVPIDPLTVTVAGQVVFSDGSMPTGGGYDQAVVRELGRAAAIVGGSYSIPTVPQGRTFTLQLQAVNPRTRMAEMATVQFTPVSNGMSNATFMLPLIVLRGSSNGFTPPL
jgi:hypothetical protein